MIFSYKDVCIISIDYYMILFLEKGKKKIVKYSSSKNLLKTGFLNAGSLTVFFFFAMLVSPDIVFTGAADGLLLWFNTIFPFTFSIYVYYCYSFKSGGLNIIANVLGKPLIFRICLGAFSVIAGFYAVIR